MRFKSRGTHLRPQDAEEAWSFAWRQGAQILVHLVDADEERWQVVRRREQDKFPSECRSQLLCGVADTRIEHWLAGDEVLLRRELDLGPEFDLPTEPIERVDAVKAVIRRRRRGDERTQDVVARLVQSATSDVLKNWRKNRAFDQFYTDCVNAACQADCPVSS